MIIPIELTIKFGGGTLKNKENLTNSVNIVKDQKAKCVIVSAAGADGKYNRMTEDLKEIAQLIKNDDDNWTNLWKERIYNRLTQEYVFEDMKLNVISLLNKAHGDLNKRTYDEIVHLGEDFMAKIVADRLGYTFVDTMNCVYLDDDGHITTMSYEAIASAVDGKNIVMSGFSGNCGGKVKLLPSGGSDIMGVTVADVTKSRFKRITETGIRVHDPKYGVANFLKIATFAEVGQMATLDEHVIHPAALHFAEDHELHIQICSFEDPVDGLRIVPKRSRTQGADVAAISCQEELVLLTISKLDLQQSKADFQSSLYRKLKKYRLHEVLSFTSKTQVQLLIPQRCLDDSDYSQGHIQSQLGRTLGSDWITFKSGWTLISLIGIDMLGQCGVFEKYSSAIGKEGLSINASLSPPDEGVIYFGFNEHDFKKAFHALRGAAFPKEKK